MSDKVYEISSDPYLQMQMDRNEKINKRLTTTDIRLIGDKSTIAQIVQLLAYIRYAVQNNMKTEIRVPIGQYVVNTVLHFDVNGQQVPDLVAQSVSEIN